MAGQLIPLPQFDSLPRNKTSMEQRISAWFDLLDLGEQMHLAGQHRNDGESTDRLIALRDWYDQGIAEHDRMMRQLMETFARRGTRDGC